MIIKKLVVYSKISEEIIREIKFNPFGLSIIMDYSDNPLTTGSNIGKTTAVKIIDLCFNAKSTSSIYKDKDTGSNVLVENFIIKNKVSAKLFIEDEKGNSIVLERDLFPRGKRCINNIEYSQENYGSELREILFGFASKDKKPTFNQLISKYIRLDATNEENLLKFNGSYTKNFEYYEIYQFLFGISREDNSFITNQERIRKNDSDISVVLRKNDAKEIEELNTKINLLSEKVEQQKNLVSESRLTYKFADDEQYILKILENLKKDEMELSNLKFKSRLYEDQINKENSNLNTISESDLSKLYNIAKDILQEKIAEYKNYLIFHNKMIEKRIETFSNLLKAANEQIDVLLTRIELNRIEYEKHKIEFDVFVNNDLERHFSDYYKNKEILASYIRDREYILNKQRENEQLIKTNKSVEVDLSQKQEIVNFYNERFKYYTNAVIGEPLNIVFTDNHEEFPIRITSAFGKPGTGMKKALITCFDLALIDMQKHFCMKAPSFEIHDKLENISIAELRGILTVAKTFKGQYVFPVLKDRVDILNINDSDIVLKLSTTDKFFRI